VAIVNGSGRSRTAYQSGLPDPAVDGCPLEMAVIERQHPERGPVRGHSAAPHANVHAANKSQEKTGVTIGIESSSWTRNSKTLWVAELADANVAARKLSGAIGPRDVWVIATSSKDEQIRPGGLKVQHPHEIGPPLDVKKALRNRIHKARAPEILKADRRTLNRMRQSMANGFVCFGKGR
jgi:hypothetical protein